MTNGEGNKKFIFLLVATALLAAIVLVLTKNNPNIFKKQQNETQVQEAPSVQEILASLPQALPVEKDASLTVAPDAKYENGKMVTTYSYVSAKALAVAAAEYAKFFSENGWDAKAIDDKETSKVFAATQNTSGDSLLVSISNNQVQNRMEVSLVLSQQLFSVLGGLPKGLPEDKSSDVKNSTGKNFVARSFVSGLSIDANYNAFKSYLAKNGWSVGSENLQSITSKGIVASKLNAKLEIVISKGSKQQNVEVFETLTILE